MTTAKTDWSALQYLLFEDERTRPSIDLLARVTVAGPARCMDLGCGPGNSTELVAARFPNATVEGMDSSEDMLAKARTRLPQIAFTLADVARWRPGPVYDLVFGNAVLQWLPDHASLFPELVGALRPGGCLAIQMPDNLDEPSHVAMARVAGRGPWAAKLARARDAKAEIGSFEDYRSWLTAAGCRVELWKTIYVHELAGPDAIVEWFKSTGLKPFIDPLDPDERAAFLTSYEAEIAASYPPQTDGKVLLKFPRLFIVATRL